MVYLTERWLPLVREWITPAAAKPIKAEPMPADLMLLVSAESEPWARDQVRSSLLEAYDELQDWDAVRARSGG